MDTTKATLKNEIKKFTREGYEARKAIQAATGLDRDAAWGVKRAIGVHARARLLAYALYRGVPYRVLESRCTEDFTGPNTTGSMGRTLLSMRVLKAIHQALPEAARAEWTRERVSAWMKVVLEGQEAAPAVLEQAAE